MVRPGGFGKTGDGWVSHTMPIADRRFTGGRRGERDGRRWQGLT
jgi:hypothetical protein